MAISIRDAVSQTTPEMTPEQKLAMVLYQVAKMQIADCAAMLERLAGEDKRLQWAAERLAEMEPEVEE